MHRARVGVAALVALVATLASGARSADAPCVDPEPVAVPKTRVTNDAALSQEPSLAWTGAHYVVAWHDYRHGDADIFFARVDTAGHRIGSEVRLTSQS